jgi:hypothetical protein
MTTTHTTARVAVAAPAGQLWAEDAFAGVLGREFDVISTGGACAGVLVAATIVADGATAQLTLEVPATWAGAAGPSAMVVLNLDGPQ